MIRNGKATVQNSSNKSLHCCREQTILYLVLFLLWMRQQMSESEKERIADKISLIFFFFTRTSHDTTAILPMLSRQAAVAVFHTLRNMIIICLRLLQSGPLKLGNGFLACIIFDPPQHKILWQSAEGLLSNRPAKCGVSHSLTDKVTAPITVFVLHLIYTVLLSNTIAI